MTMAMVKYATSFVGRLSRMARVAFTFPAGERVPTFSYFLALALSVSYIQGTSSCSGDSERCNVPEPANTYECLKLDAARLSSSLS